MATPLLASNVIRTCQLLQWLALRADCFLADYADYADEADYSVGDEAGRTVLPRNQKHSSVRGCFRVVRVIRERFSAREVS